MSEILDQADAINININNSDSSGGSTSFLDRIFDIGLKLIIPLGLLIGLIAVGVLVRVVLPLVDFVGGVDLGGSLGIVLPFGLSGAIAGFGAVAGWLVGR